MSEDSKEKPTRQRVVTQEMWQIWTQWPMALAAVAFLAIYSVQVIAETTDGQKKLPQCMYMDSVGGVPCRLCLKPYYC